MQWSFGSWSGSFASVRTSLFEPASTMQAKGCPAFIRAFGLIDRSAGSGGGDRHVQASALSLGERVAEGRVRAARRNLRLLTLTRASRTLSPVSYTHLRAHET